VEAALPTDGRMDIQFEEELYRPRTPHTRHLSSLQVLENEAIAAKDEN